MRESGGIYSPSSAVRGAKVAWAAVLAWMLAIVVLSALPIEGAGWIRVPLGIDKWVHAAFYGLLAVLGAAAWSATGAGSGVAAVRGAALGISYGAVVEWIQSFFPRTPSLADWVADLVGAVIGAAGWWLARRRTNRTEGG